jgi:glycosyltransferase involved in cell wall biosynthesis
VEHVSRDPSEATPAARRLLLVSVHFPPSTAIGARRWARMIALGAAWGWFFDVITVRGEGGDAPRRPTADGLPASTRILRVELDGLPLHDRLMRWRSRRREDTPRSTAATAGNGSGAGGAEETPSERFMRRDAPLSRAARNALATADMVRMHTWSRRVEEEARVLTSDTSYAAVISSGPPHMAHLAAGALSRATGAPHVVDLRDPWAHADLAPSDYRSAAWLAFARHYERQCLEGAALVVANNDVARDDIVRRLPSVASRTIAVLNGSDGDCEPAPGEHAPFRIVFAGSLYVGRDPSLLFAAVRRAVDALALAPTDLRVEFAGDADFEGHPVAELASAAGIAPYFEHHGRLGAPEVDALLRRAHVLVSLPQTAHYSVPAKMFEYVQYGAWLLLFATPGSASEVTFRDSDVAIVAPDDVDATARRLAEWIERSRRGERPRAANADGRFSRALQAERFYGRLDQLVTSPAPRG